MEQNPKTQEGALGPVLDESAEDFYENAPCGYLSSLPDGTIVKVNQTFLRWTGFGREEILAGKRFQDLLTVGCRIFYETHYAPLLQMQGFVHEIALDLLCKDRRQVPILANSVQRLGADGKPAFFRTTIVDVTERKRYERELLLARKKAEEAANAKADFISMISHEIRTPLNAILGVAHLLSGTSPSPPQQKLLAILRSSSENLLGLINDILDFSKIEAGKVQLEERRFDLRQVVGDIVTNLSVKAQEKGLPVRVDIDERLPDCMLGDPVKIGQIVTNLLGNAIKFTAQGSVTVAVRVKETHADRLAIEVKVADTGIGIAEDQLARIFEDFSQASYEISLKFGGTGLGLAITRKLLQLHGSEIYVDSAPGRGSTFFFTLSLKRADAAQQLDGQAEAGAHQRVIKGLKVLIADDNEVNIYVLSKFLTKWGVEFDAVQNGRQAVDKVKQGDYQLVLIDLRMPELSGFDATRELRSSPDPRLRGLPIIAISASTRMGHRDEIDAAGFTDFIGKPISPDILLEKLARYAPRP